MKRKAQISHVQTNSLRFLSNNSNLIVCGNQNGIISLFSTKTSRIVWTNNDSAGNSILSVAVSSNEEIVAGGGFKKCLLVINAANGDSVCSIDVGSIVCRVLFLSQQKIACGLGNGTVAIVRWQTQTKEKKLKVGERAVFALALSPVNFDILLTGDGAGVIKQTIISSEKTVMAYEGHTRYVKVLSFLSCGNIFVSGSGDQTARLFALDQKQAIRVFKGHTGDVRSVSLIHDDEFLITTSWDDTVKVWKIENGECLSTTVEAEQNVHCAAVSKDKQSLVIGGLEGVTMFSLPCSSLDGSVMLIFN